MLFHSHVFLFLFLPVTLLGFYALGARSQNAAALWLVAASLFFYGWWNPRYLPLLVGSALFNYWIGASIGRAVGLRRRKSAHVFLVVGVTANLGALGYFKYAGFLVANVRAVTGVHWSIGTIALPLAISFFTFTQIAYLVDAWYGRTREYGLLHYALFVTFFPHLVAGPIVLYRSLLPQFVRSDTYWFQSENFASALTVFVCGLAKKVIVADGLAPIADTVFNAAAQGAPQGAPAAWLGVAAYSLQIYFDFSGYSDMAVGLASMFNVKFPLNFDSPYKARDIIDFWRRWHITLSTFLRDHLYRPLGGNRYGRVRRYVNLLLTMLLGGLWHGAGWTFVIWGGLHGACLCVNHGWRRVAANWTWAQNSAARFAGWGLTLFIVAVGWVFFRSASASAASSILEGMLGMHGWRGPIGFAPEKVALLASAGAIVLLGPNSQQLFSVAVQAKEPVLPIPPKWTWTPGSATVAAIVLVVSVLHLSKISDFLYFQF